MASSEFPRRRASAGFALGSRAGFSLVELLVGLAIGAFGLSVAAYVAQVAVRQSGKGQVQNQLSSSSQVIGGQLRDDLSVAGVGSTGAIGVTAASLLSAVNGVLTPAGRRAIAAVTGIDNAPIGLGGRNLMPGSDVVQVVVPNPASAVSLGRFVAPGQPATQLYAPANLRAVPTAQEAALAAAMANCALLYVLDVSGTTGAGRTQLLVRATDVTAFAVGADAQVMCARLTTYWLDNRMNLHATDWAAGASAAAGRVFMPTATLDTDVIAAGVADFQVAYRVSSAVAGVTTNADAWAYDAGAVSPAEPTLGAAVGYQAWFEVRQVRYSLLMRTIRSPEDARPSRLGPGDAMENRVAATMVASLSSGPLGAAAVGGQHTFRRAGSTATLQSMRFFDRNQVATAAAEPY